MTSFNPVARLAPWYPIAPASTFFFRKQRILIGFVAILPLFGAAALWLIKERAARLHWAVSVGVAFLPVLGIVFLGLQLPLDFSFSSWRPDDLFQAVLLLRLDSISWPLALAAASIPVSLFLCGPSRPASTNPATRSLVLLYVGLSTIGLMAANAPTVIMTWVAADIVGFLALLGSADNIQTVRGGYRRFFTHLASAVFILAGAVSIESTFYTSWLRPTFWVLAVALRLGLWPLHVAMPEMPGVRRGLGVALRLMPPLMGLGFLARFTVGEIPGVLAGWLLVLAAISVFIGGLRWAVSADPIKSRPFFVLSIAGMSIAAAAGAEDSSDVIVGLAGTMALVGTVVSQLEIYQKWHRYLLGFVVAFAAGFPYTLGHAAHYIGDAARIGELNGIVAAILMAVGFGAVLLGIARGIDFQTSDWESGESFVRNAYAVGLIFPLAMLLAAGIWRGTGPTGRSLMSLVLTIGLATIGWFGLNRLGSPARQLIQASSEFLNESVERGISDLLWSLMAGISSVLRWMGRFFEGRAGLLWIYVTLLMIALLVAGTGG